METTYIYTLTDPITDEIRYVGKANNVNERYRAHLNKARKHQTHKKNWIESLKKKGYKPIVEVIDIVSINDWKFWEQYWISQMRTWGFNLINYTEGGDGCTFGNQTSFKNGHGSVPVVQLKLNGTFVREYESAKYVKDHLNLRIDTALDNIGRTAGEHIWLRKKTYDCLSKENLDEYVEAAKRDNRYNRNDHGNSKKTRFKKGQEVWNKGLSGYKLNARSVIQYTKDGVFIKEYRSCKEASEYVNCCEDNIRNVIYGYSKTAKGFLWKYKEEDEKTKF